MQESANEATFTQKVIKVNSDLAVIIPADIVKKLNLKLGDNVEVTIEKVENGRNL